MTSLQQAQAARDAAIDQANRGAGPEWHAAADAALRQHAKVHAQFLAEDVRVSSGLPQPKDNRAWGAVFARAARAGLIRRVGYGPSTTGHCRPMPIWTGEPPLSTRSG